MTQRLKIKEKCVLAFLILVFCNILINSHSCLAAVSSTPIQTQSQEVVDRTDTDLILEFFETLMESASVYDNIQSLDQDDLSEGEYKAAYDKKIKERYDIYLVRKKELDQPYQFGDIKEVVQISEVQKFAYGGPIRTALFPILVNNPENHPFVKPYSIALTDLISSYLFLIPEFSHLGIKEGPGWREDVHYTGIVPQDYLEVIAKYNYRDILFAGILNPMEDDKFRLKMIVFDSMNGLVRNRLNFEISLENPAKCIPEIIRKIAEIFEVSVNEDVLNAEAKKLENLSLEAIRYYGDAKRLTFEYGELYFSKEYQKAALYALHQAHMLAPTWFLPTYRFADRIKRANLDVAISYSKRSLDQYPYSPEGWWALEMLYLKKFGGKSDEAMGAALKSVEVGPWHGYSLLCLASRYNHRSDYLKAYKYSKLSLGLAINMDVALANFIKNCFMTRNHKDLWDIYNQTWATEYQDMLDEEAGRSIGEVIEEDDPDLAIKYYQHLIDKGFYVRYSLLQIGWIYSNHFKDQAMAMDYYMRAKEDSYSRDNKEDMVYSNLTIAKHYFYQSKEYDKAEAFIRETKLIDPSEVPLDFAVAILQGLSQDYIAKGQEVRVKELFDDYEDLMKNFHGYWDARSEYMVKANEDKTIALEYAKKSVKNSKRCVYNYEHIFNLGKVYYMNGKYIDAIRAFNQCINIKPGLMRHYYLLALAEYKYGDIDEAVAHLKKAKNNLPNYRFSSKIERVINGKIGEIDDIIYAE